MNITFDAENQHFARTYYLDPVEAPLSELYGLRTELTELIFRKEVTLKGLQKFENVPEAILKIHEELIKSSKETLQILDNFIINKALKDVPEKYNKKSNL